MWPLRSIWFLTTRFSTLTYKGNTIAIASIFILPPPTSLDIAGYWKFKYDHITAQLKNQIGAPMSGLSSFSASCLPFPLPQSLTPPLSSMPLPGMSSFFVNLWICTHLSNLSWQISSMKSSQIDLLSTPIPNLPAPSPHSKRVKDSFLWIHIHRSL